MFGIGVTEFGIILVVALLVFGPKRLPELARTLGRGMGEFRRATNELRQSLALDDLQSDLRRDLEQAGRIHKPSSERPAQAGDDLTAPDAAPGAAPDATRDATGDAIADASPGAADEKRHPGELPLGNDDEHHERPEEPAEEAGGDGTRADHERAAEGPPTSSGSARG